VQVYEDFVKGKIVYFAPRKLKSKLCIYNSLKTILLNRHVLGSATEIHSLQKGT